MSSSSSCGRKRPLPPGGPRPSDVLRRFLLNAVAYLLAAAVAGVWTTVTDGYWSHWLALHLAFVGAISLMVVGAGQFFATAFLMTAPPRLRLVHAQLAAWNAGTLLVAVGVPRGVRPLTDAGAALLLVGLGLFAGSLRGLTRRSLQRAHWAVLWYLASAAFLGVGAVIGALMAGGTSISGGSLLGAHIALNVGGWFGTAIVGTLHTFYPSLTHTLLRHPRLQRPTFAAWCAGVVVLALGYATGAAAVVVAGWALLAAAATLLAINMVASRRAATELRLPGRLVGAAQPFLVAGLVAGLVGALRDGALAPVAGDQRTLLTALLLAGWVGMTVAGSLLQLLTVLARVRNPLRPMAPAAPARDRAVTAVAVASVLAAALGFGGAALPVAAIVVGAFVARELVAALVSRRPAAGTASSGRRPTSRPSSSGAAR